MSLNLPQRPAQREALSNPAPADVAAELRRRLEATVEGEVRFDARARALYATDASPYRIAPVGVVVPRDEADVVAAVRAANELGVPVLPRGGGTSLAGQTVAAALVIDMSKYLTKIIELNVEERWVRVQPGLVRDQLNAALAPHSLQFTPDVATTDRANVGGMVANNSAGTRSIKYGKSVDQVIELRVLLMDGTELHLGPLRGKELDEKLAAEGREGDIYRAVHRMVSEHADEIAARYPKVMRRVGGYNLDELTDAGGEGQRPFNLAKVVSGSEGTLALILELKLALHPVPKRRLVTMLHFDSLTKAFEAVQFINRHGPSAVEIIDADLIMLGRENPAIAPLMTWVVGDPAAVLLVEFDGEDLAVCRAALAGLEADPEVAALTYGSFLAEDPKQQKEIADFRRDGLGIYATMPGAAKPTPSIEDAAIPVEHLARYIPEVIEVCRRHGTRAVFYAHASVGVIHVRPLLDLKDEAGIERYQAISKDVFELVLKYGGSWSGEHGDGLIRSYQNRRLFGDVLYQDFIDLKRAFDPAWLLNPGKIVEAPAMTENLRYGTDYPAVVVPTVFDFEA
ncbi:MAG: FAD-binding oxidoreductase, partial [Trueperaceae bacterium]